MAVLVVETSNAVLQMSVIAELEFAVVLLERDFLVAVAVLVVSFVFIEMQHGSSFIFSCR